MSLNKVKIFYKLGRMLRKTRINSNRIQLSTLYKRGLKNFENINCQIKIIGLVRVKNEFNIIGQHLKALALVVDSIIVLDDNSKDGTYEIIESLANKINIIEIIRNTDDNYNEWEDRRKLLKIGRERGGTHFVVLDADEMFTANIVTGNLLRKIIFGLSPGDIIEIEMFNLWRSINKFRADRSIWSGNTIPIIYCDDGKGMIEKKFIHFPRLPNKNGRIYSIKGGDKGVLHFQFVNWNNLIIKQAWYRCLERIHVSGKTVEEINSQYEKSKNERNIILKGSPISWFEEYLFFDSEVYASGETWRKSQVEEWIRLYGVPYFLNLDIWDINWNLE